MHSLFAACRGINTYKYLQRIPEDSGVATSGRLLNESHITPEKTEKIAKLKALATQGGHKLADMAFSWLLKDKSLARYLWDQAGPGKWQIL